MDVKRLSPPRRVVMFEPGGLNVYKLRGTPGGQKPYCQARSPDLKYCVRLKTQANRARCSGGAG